MALGTLEVGSVVQTSWGKESPAGTLQTNLTAYPYVSNTIDTSKTEITEQDIRGDRQEVFSRHGNVSVGGTLNTGLRHSNYDDLFESLFFNTFDTSASAVTAAADISADDATNSFQSTSTDFTTLGLVVGQYVKVSGFQTLTNTTNNGVFKVMAIASNELTVQEDVSDEAAPGSVDIEPLKFLDIGLSHQSFTMQKFFGRTGLYQVLRGCLVDSVAVNVNQDQAVTTDWNILGLEETFGTNTIAADTDPDDPVQRDPMVHIEGTIFEGGVERGVITSATINMANNVDPAFVIGKTFAEDLSYGNAQISGTFDAFFDDDNLKNKFLNETETSLQLKLTDKSNFVVIDLPRVKVNSATLPVNDPGRVVQSVEFRALKDTTLDTSARFSSTL